MSEVPLYDPSSDRQQCPNYDVKANIHLLSTVSVHPCRGTSIIRNEPHTPHPLTPDLKPKTVQIDAEQL